MAKEATRRENALKAADDRRRCKLKVLTRSTQRQRHHTDQGDRAKNRAGQGDLEEGNLGEAITMIPVKGPVVATRDVPRAHAAAYRRADAAAELSVLMGEGRSKA
jgi:hypothetical protein